MTSQPPRVTQDPYQAGWSAGYAAARRYYGDDTQIALGKLRETLGPVLEKMPPAAAGTPGGQVLAAMMDIIDAAGEAS